MNAFLYLFLLVGALREYISHSFRSKHNYSWENSIYGDRNNKLPCITYEIIKIKPSKSLILSLFSIHYQHKTLDTFILRKSIVKWIESTFANYLF